ncbi:DUF1508 domain-containing protein [Candidatus Woesebacteria bacterium]|nr:DUF1508 domain-containing protein [Candidatus Woesebacteria bacterium]
MAKFEIYFSKAADYRWRLKAANGEIVAISEGYTEKASAIRSARRIQELAPLALIDDIS